MLSVTRPDWPGGSFDQVTPPPFALVAVSHLLMYISALEVITTYSPLVAAWIALLLVPFSESINAQLVTVPPFMISLQPIMVRPLLLMKLAICCVKCPW